VGGRRKGHTEEEEEEMGLLRWVAWGVGAVVVGVVGVGMMGVCGVSPWPLPRHVREKERGAVVFGGSFNPLHEGHVHVIKQLCARFSTVYVVLAVNPSKSNPATTSTAAIAAETAAVVEKEKGEMVKRRVEELVRSLREVMPDAVESGAVKVEFVEGYLWRFVYREDVRAVALARGFRSARHDLRHEATLCALNIFGPLIIGRKPPVQTIFVPARHDLKTLSSTLIRERNKSNSNHNLQT